MKMKMLGRPDRDLRGDKPAGWDAKRLAALFKARVSIFRRAPAGSIHALAARAFIRRCVKGQFLCHAGEASREVWVLLAGRVAVNRCGWRGNRVGLEIMLPGDIFGLPAIACSTYPSEIVATSECLLAAIPRAEMLKGIEAYPELAREILLVFGERLDFMEAQLQLSREDVEKRIIAALLYLSHKFGRKLPVTRAELGQMAGTTPETTMRVLKRLEQRGWLGKFRGGVALRDQEALQSRLTDGGSPR